MESIRRAFPVERTALHEETATLRTSKTEQAARTANVNILAVCKMARRRDESKNICITPCPQKSKPNVFAVTLKMNVYNVHRI